MSASKIRADYEQLAEMAQIFGRQADTARQVLSALQKDVETLQGGDWLGPGAEAFYAEMTSAVVPAMGRLIAALSEAASATAKIGRIMKQAEAESAALFKLDDAGAFTEAELQEWRRRHPDAEQQVVPAFNGKRTQDKDYTPDELWWKGYFYAKTVDDNGLVYEGWRQLSWPSAACKF
jgi:WXG100 family type VII secretion target